MDTLKNCHLYPMGLYYRYIVFFCKVKLHYLSDYKYQKTVVIYLS